MMLQCVRLALWASYPQLPASRFVHGLERGVVDEPRNLVGPRLRRPAPPSGAWSTALVGHLRHARTATASTRASIPVGHGAVPVGHRHRGARVVVPVARSSSGRCGRESTVPASTARGAARQMKLQPYGGGQLSGQMLGHARVDGARGRGGRIPRRDHGVRGHAHRRHRRADLDQGGAASCSRMARRSRSGAARAAASAIRSTAIPQRW